MATTWGEYYHEIAGQMALYRITNRRLCALAELRPGMTVVDLGCGSGLTSLAALEQVPEGLRLILVDSSRPMVEAAKRHLGDRAAVCHVADAAEAAGLVKGRVDRVLCNMALWTFRSPEGVLRAWREKLNPTGLFCFNLFGTYFNAERDVVSPQYALIQELHRRGLLGRGLPAVDRLPNQRSIEGTLTGAGFKPVRYEVQAIESDPPDTEPGGELYNLMRLTPALPGSDFRDAVARSLAVLPELAGAIAAAEPRWRVAHFTAQPAVDPGEALLARFSGRLPGGR